MTEALRQILNVLGPLCIVLFFISAAVAAYMSTKDFKPDTTAYTVAKVSVIATGLLLVSFVVIFLVGSLYI